MTRRLKRLWRLLFPPKPSVAQAQKDRAHWAASQERYYGFPFPADNRDA